MSLVRLTELSKGFGSVALLRQADFRVEAGEKIGLIGRNGTGKTTILRLIAGEMQPDSGNIERMRKVRIAYLPQLPQFDPHATVFDVILATFSELTEIERRLAELEHRMHDSGDSLLKEYSALQDHFAARGGYEYRTRAKRVLHGLGFLPDDFGLPVRNLSGGQTTRLLLALVLVRDADLLLFDEPENHLDIDAREWLEAYLKESSKALVMVSHDRRMLNTVPHRTVEIERGNLTSFSGNYDFYLRQKTLLLENQQKAFDRQQDLIQKEQQWIDRFRAKNTKATLVQSRVKRLEKLERIEAPPQQAAAPRFGFAEVTRTGEVVLDAAELSMRYGALQLYDGFSLQVRRGERVGIIGPNGSGKTTLLRQLAGRLEGANGTVTLGHKVVLGFYEQRHESLNPANDILGEVALARPDLRPEDIRSSLGRFLFTGDDVFKPISAISGGELSRVAIAKLILTRANLLLLDEPTNHLDVASREAIEAALSAFPGALLVVSHDRMLIDRLVERLVIIENGRAEQHLGNYSDYRFKRQQREIEEEARARTAAKLVVRTPKPGREQERELRKRQRQAEEIEAAIARTERQIQDIEAEFGKLRPTEYQTAQTMKAGYESLKTRLDQLYAEWETLSD